MTLNWKPTDDIFELKKIDCELLRSKHIKLEKIIDTRNVDMKELIGANKENPARSLQVTTKSDVVDFIHSNLVKVFKEMYLDFDNQNADYSLTGEIKEFYAEENPGYAGSLTMQMTLKKANKIVWTGLITGSSKRTGRSYSLDNYMETLSDAIMDFAKQFAENKSLYEKLK